MSSASTPAPGALSESRNFVNTPRPFKNPSYTKPSNRRTRTLKQILASERDLAMGMSDGLHSLGGSGSIGGRKGGMGKSKRGLTGAAAAAARRREEQNAATSTNSADVSGMATPVGNETGDVSVADFEGDTTMNSVAGTGTQTPAVLDAESEELARRRKALPTYSNIEAPPSLRPRKKFCDITGLIAPYTDPKTGLRYHSVEIYEIIKTFGPGVDQSYLTLRGEATQIK